ncbi:MAG TPA: DUF58 domain-containing protein [Acidimicrobiales bacterium]|nr:DUF58 domain-containing protein [Acidimicrobiales bacterium]
MTSLTAASRAAAAGLELTVLRRLDGLLQGDHAGLLPGHGSETGEARIYAPGDDTRRLDWSLTARTTVPHVRDTISDHELELWLVVDDSASLAFGTARCEKHDVAWAAAGAFALLAAKGGNRVGALTATGRQTGFPARSGRAHVGAILAALRRPPEDGDHADLAATLVTLRRHARRRGLVVVVSDFLVPDGWESPLRALASRHDVIAVEVLDPRELELPDVGPLALVDPESGRRRMVDTGDARLRDRYATAAAEHRAELTRRISATGAHHLVLRTDRDWVVDLVRFVGRRRSRRSSAARSINGSRR